MNKALHSYSMKMERFGLEPVPQHLKTSRWFDFGIIQFSIAVNSGNFLVPAFAVLQGQLSFSWAILSTTLGATFAFLCIALLSLPGAKYGIPGQFAIRSILGVKGSQYIASPARTFASLYWFAVQTIGGTLIIQSFMLQLFGISLSFLPLAIGLALIMSLLAVIGFEAVKKFNRYFIPFLILGSFSMIYVFFQSTNEHFHFAYVIQSPEANNTIGAFLLFFSLSFAQYVAGVTSSSDNTRYARTTKDAFFGLFGGYFLGFVLTAFIAAYAATAARDWNPIVVAGQQTNSLLLLCIITFSALIAMISINLHNAYTGGYSLLNTFPQLGRIRSSIIFGIIATFLSCFPIIVDEAKDYISPLSILITPLMGVVVADYLFLKKMNIDLTLATEYNKTAIWCIGLGCIIYIFTPETWSPGIIAFLSSAILYLGVHYYEMKRKPHNKPLDMSV